MSLPRAVKGYIFKQYEHWETGQYYRDFMEGMCHSKSVAHVYTMAEIEEHWCDGWADKEQGKWIVVYEDAPLLLLWQQPPAFIHE